MSDALSIFTNLGDCAGQADALDAVGKVYQSQGRYQDAINKYQEALGIRQEIGDRAGEATSQNNLGDAYHALRNYNKAKEAHTRAFEIFADPEINAIAGLANARNSLGVVYCSLENYSEAISLIKQALETRRNIGDRAGVADSLCNLGNIYCISKDHQDYQQAENFYEEALSILQEIKHCEFMAKALNGLGDVCLAKKQYEDAASNYEKAWQFYQSIGNTKKAEHSRLNQAKSHHNKAQYILIENGKINREKQFVSALIRKAKVLNAQLNQFNREKQFVSALIRKAKVLNAQLNQFVGAQIFVTTIVVIAVGIIIVASVVISSGAFIVQTVVFAVAGIISLGAFIAQIFIFATGVILVVVAIFMSCVVVWKICDLPQFNFNHYQKVFFLVLLGFVLVQPYGNYFKLLETKIKVPSSPIIQETSPSKAPLSGYRVMCPPDIQELNVRQLPSLSASVVSTIPCDTTGVQIIGKETRAGGEIWVKIKYQKIQGWSVKRFLSKR